MVSESGPNYAITASVSQLVLTIPKQGLVADKAGTDPMYFSFNDSPHALIVSGWFSPADGFHGIKEFWAAESADWQRRTGTPEPSNVAFEQMGSWNLVFYDFGLRGVTSANVRAHWVDAGTWIDVHISKTSDRRLDLRTELRNVLKSFTVTVKGRFLLDAAGL